jgi:hypothetical protein
MSVPLALNDPSGTWRITAREVISGNDDTVKVNVR